MEIKDIKFPIEDNDDSFPPDCAVKKWADLILEGTILVGRACDSAKNYKSQLEDAGFTNVVEIKYKWPMNRWPKDPGLKELGMFTSFSLYLPFPFLGCFVAEFLGEGRGFDLERGRKGVREIWLKRT